MRYVIDSDNYGNGFRVVAEGKWPKGKVAALKESIRKWEWLAGELKAHPEYDGLVGTAQESCALCEIYNPLNGPDDEVNECKGCPIMAKTGLQYCEGTPYKWLPTAVQARKFAKWMKALLPRKGVGGGK